MSADSELPLDVADYLSPTGECYGILVKGEPIVYGETEIQPGDLLIVDRTLQPRAGAPVLVETGSDLTVRLYVGGGRRVGRGDIPCAFAAVMKARATRL